MTNVVAYYQTRLHQFSECLTNFSPLIGKFISFAWTIKHCQCPCRHGHLLELDPRRQQIDCRVDEYRGYATIPPSFPTVFFQYRGTPLSAIRRHYQLETKIRRFTSLFTSIILRQPVPIASLVPVVHEHVQSF